MEFLGPVTFLMIRRFQFTVPSLLIPEPEVQGRSRGCSGAFWPGGSQQLVRWYSGKVQDAATVKACVEPSREQEEGKRDSNQQSWHSGAIGA